MNTSSHQMRNEGIRDAFFDITSILAVALIGLVLLVITNPRVGPDIGTLLRPAQTHSSQVANQSAGR
jgi:biopolymer transport protein ExbD